ncbi:hypothetical protein CRENBAI_024230 [Crenichthys baileyi]|uniref:Uncharacterized protein n=1 Tax=Crenichthys baileyi TaxID=28760 RepID=A0AAV9RHS9_9TELE
MLMVASSSTITLLSSGVPGLKRDSESCNDEVAVSGQTRPKHPTPARKPSPDRPKLATDTTKRKDPARSGHKSAAPTPNTGADQQPSATRIRHATRRAMTRHASATPQHKGTSQQMCPSVPDAGHPTSHNQASRATKQSHFTHRGFIPKPAPDPKQQLYPKSKAPGKDRYMHSPPHSPARHRDHRAQNRAATSRPHRWTHSHPYHDPRRKDPGPQQAEGCHSDTQQGGHTLLQRQQTHQHPGQPGDRAEPTADPPKPQSHSINHTSFCAVIKWDGEDR